MAVMLFRTLSSNLFLVYPYQVAKVHYVFGQNLGTMLNATNKRLSRKGVEYR
jgi:hypothetical protein